MTLPFFGSGIVELPPEGFKRAKNSRKMQMVFFVHQGKVLVTVGPPALENGGTANDAETNEFAISKGGVWVVPRGMFSNSLFSLLCFDTFSLPARRKPHRHLSRKYRFNQTLQEKRSEKSASSSSSLSSKITVQTEAVCATSRRDNLSITPEHRTSCVALHPVFFRHCAACLSGRPPTSPRRVTSQLPVRVHVFGRTPWPACLAAPVAREPECRATLRRRGCGRLLSYFTMLLNG
jgi:hypothetical protein